VAAACVLINIHHISTNANNVIIRWTGELANPSMGSVQAYKMADRITIIRLPYLATKKPATGSEVSNPMGRQRSIPPKAALLTPNFACISGMREAQEKKQIPARKKKLLTAMRFKRRCARGIITSKLLVLVKKYSLHRESRERINKNPPEFGGF
jgi:hypothetical protein